MLEAKNERWHRLIWPTVYAMAWLTAYEDAPHTRYHAEFRRSTLKGLGISKEPPQLRSAGAPPLGRARG